MSYKNKTKMMIMIYFNRLLASHPDIFLWASDSLSFDNFWTPWYKI